MHISKGVIDFSEMELICRADTIKKSILKERKDIANKDISFTYTITNAVGEDSFYTEHEK